MTENELVSLFQKYNLVEKLQELKNNKIIGEFGFNKKFYFLVYTNSITIDDFIKKILIKKSINSKPNKEFTEFFSSSADHLFKGIISLLIYFKKIDYINGFDFFPLEKLKFLNSDIVDNIEVDKITLQIKDFLQPTKYESNKGNNAEFLTDIMFASHLIYNFSSNEYINKFNNEFLHLSDEIEISEIDPYSFELEILSSVPILMKLTEDYKVKIIFNSIKTSQVIPPSMISSESLLKFFENMYKIFNETKKVFIKFENSDFLIHDIIKSLIEPYDLFYCKEISVDSFYEDIINQNIYLYHRKSNFDPKIYEEIFLKLIPKLSLYKCNKCNNYFILDEKECFLYKHEGERLPFENGEMEEFEIDENGEEIVYYNYSCCGEVISDDPGCKKEPNGLHEKDENEITITSYQINI